MIKNIPSIKKMMLGIMVMLVGGFIMLNKSIDLKGFEFFIILGGLLIGIISIFLDD